MSLSFSGIMLDRTFYASSDCAGVICLKQESKVVYLINVPHTIHEAFLEVEVQLGVEHRFFRSVQEYLQHNRTEESACIIMDLQTHAQEELSAQLRLARAVCPPVIFICGHSDVSVAVRAAKSGAIEVLTLPLERADLVKAVKTGLEVDRKHRQRRAEHTELQKRYIRLTPREKDVLPLIASGLLNKQAAAVLGISEVTLQIHRSHVMRKMRAESLPHLVRMAWKLHIPFWTERHPGVPSLRPTSIHSRTNMVLTPQRSGR